MLHQRDALSVLDGRYASLVDPLREFLSEFAYVKLRYRVEVDWLQRVVEIQKPELIVEVDWVSLREFTHVRFQKFKEHEAVTNHDVKAIEYTISDLLPKGSPLRSLIHFGLTSEDVNSIAHSEMHLEVRDLMIVKVEEITNKLLEMATQYKHDVMLGRTHGQPATPTTFGKEFAVFASRLDWWRARAKSLIFTCKFGGATGNHAALLVANREVNWLEESSAFISKRGFHHALATTQIDSHDSLVALCSLLSELCGILLDLSVDAWLYISQDLFSLNVVQTETGSSTMPHKVNPILFENAEANLGISQALYQHFSATLPRSRLQRDLSDSSRIRSLAAPHGHLFIGLTNILRGLGKITPNVEKARVEVSDKPELLSEAVQTVMRLRGKSDGYEILKSHTRGSQFTAASLKSLLEENKGLFDDSYDALRELKPEAYVGYSAAIVDSEVRRIKGNLEKK